MQAVVEKRFASGVNVEKCRTWMVKAEAAIIAQEKVKVLGLKYLE